MERPRRAPGGRQRGVSKQYNRSAQRPVPTRVRRAATLRSGRILADTEKGKRTPESDSERGTQNVSTTVTRRVNARHPTTPKRGTWNRTTGTAYRPLRAESPSIQNPDDAAVLDESQTIAEIGEGSGENDPATPIIDEERADTTAMEALLSRIYYDVRHKAGFSSVRKLYNAVKDKKGGYTYKLVKQWLMGQEAYNLFKPARISFPRPRIHIDGMDACWEMDLMIMRHVFTTDGSEKEASLPEANDGYAYILLVVYAFSKYMWAQPCKTKTSQEVAKAFEEILRTATPRSPASLRSDLGGEFTGKPFANVVKTLGIPHFWAYSELKAVFVERSIKTVKSRLRKYIDYTGQMRYVDVLQDVVQAYNTSVHSSTGRAPETVTHDDRDAIEYYAYLNDRNPRPKKKPYGFKRGDTVVLSKLRGAFRREYDEKYSHEIYRIKSRYKRSGIPVYVLTEYDGSLIKGTFYEEELQHVTVTPNRRYTVEKILRKRGGNVLLKWRGWGTKYAQWQPADTIITKKTG